MSGGAQPQQQPVQQQQQPQQVQAQAQLGQGLTDTQQMMYAFGDSRRPNLESAKMVEQLRSILHLATAVAAQRSSDILIVEDILFLMRRNPIKIQRLIRYLRAKDKVNELSMIEKGEPVQDRRFHSVTRCRAFLSKIDDTGVLLAACDQEYSDENYLERLMRLDRMTRVMDEKRYLEFCRARAVSFKGKYSQWFQNALQEVVDTLDIKLEKLTNDVICYLAYETLGQFMELCLVVRRDYVSNTGDSLSRLQPIQAVNPAYPSISLPVRDKQAGGQQQPQQQKKSDFVGTAITPAENKMADKGNLVQQFEDSFQKCISVLTEDDETITRNAETTQNTIDERLTNFTDLARQLETYFIQKRFLIYNYKPEIVLREDTSELRSELVKKDELIRKHYDKLQQWQAMLADVQFELEPKNSGTRPASVPGGLTQPGAPGGPGQPPPGSIPTGGGPLQPGSYPLGAGPMTRMPGPMYGGGGSGQSLQGPLAHLERTTSSIGGPLGATGGGSMPPGGPGVGGGPPPGGMMMGGGGMMGGGMMR